jgi:hypothetical protein
MYVDVHKFRAVHAVFLVLDAEAAAAKWAALLNSAQSR